MSNIDEKENWLPVPGYEGYYEVSDLGKVRSMDRMVFNLGCGAEQQLRGKELKPALDNYGYPVVNLYAKGKIEHVRVGWLVLGAFVGPHPENAEMCHAPGSNAENCHLEVLRWDTHSANLSDHFGNRHLADKDIIEIRERRLAGETQAMLGKEFGRTQATIGCICRGEVYAHVGGPRSFGDPRKGTFRVERG